MEEDFVLKINSFLTELNIDQNSEEWNERDENQNGYHYLAHIHNPSTIVIFYNYEKHPQ